jgi:hypothetical protein
MSYKNMAKSSMAFLIRQLFSAIGFLFALFFTIRGICQVVFTYTNYSGETSTVFPVNRIKDGWPLIIGDLKHSYVPALDMILMILCGLMLIHGILGVYYAISTNYNLKRMIKEKRWFYLQIISAFGAAFAMIAIMRPISEMKTHPLIFYISIILVAVIGSFHIANGFFNASITLGISVSKRTKLTFRILAWIIAIISVLQIIIFFI